MAKKMFKDSEAPLYEIMIEEDGNTGIRLISLVQDPAIEVTGLAFSKQENFEFKNLPDRQMLVGPALIPNKKIARKDEDGDPYFVYFSPETIRLMVEKFNRDNNNKSINVDHSSTMAKSAYIMQNWIISDAYYDKSKSYGFNLPVGTWFIEVKFDSTEEWQEYVRSGGRYSFSVEGQMGMKPDGYENYERLFNLIDELTESEILQLFSDFATGIISFDFDGTLSTNKGQHIAKKVLTNPNDEVFIITKRFKDTESDEVYEVADELGIKKENIYFTNGKKKDDTIKRLGIQLHYDDQQVEIDSIIKNTKCKCIKI